jgi:hypothetical protein
MEVMRFAAANLREQSGIMGFFNWHTVRWRVLPILEPH